MYVMTGANCAGLRFNKNGSVSFINETGCFPTDFRVRWIDNSTFFLVDTERTNEVCPPRNYIYKILSFDGITLKVLDYWSGWGNLKDSVLTMRKK